MTDQAPHWSHFGSRKLQFLAGVDLPKTGKEQLPPKVFRHLHPDLTKDSRFDEFRRKYPNATHPTNPTQLAVAMGVTQQTLQGWYNAMPVEQQDRLALMFGFLDVKPIKDAWDDFSQFQAFETAFTEHWNKVLAAAPVARTTAALPHRDTSIPLIQGPDRYLERSLIRNLASIELTCGNTGAGETVIGVIVSCGDAEVPGSPFRITLRAADIEIDCGKAKAAPDSVKGMAKGGAGRFDVEATHGIIRCKWNGDMQRLRWLLDATGTSIGTVEFEPGILARIERLAPGDVITGTLGTFLKNIEADETAPARPVEEITFVDRVGDRVEPPPEDLSVLQRRVMEHLRKKTLTLDDAGYAVLARHELEFMKRQN